MSNGLALEPYCAALAWFSQEPSVQWRPDYIVREPTLVVKLYLLFVLLSLFVAIANLARNWILLPSFKHVEAETLRHAAVALRRQALSLQRWMILNVLAWAFVTAAGIVNLFREMSVFRTAGLQVMAVALADLLRPLALLLLVLIALYVVRWHILWRVERHERWQQSTPLL